MTQRRTVAVLAPHPDDESIFCGGVLASLAAAGHRTIVIAATTGDAGLATDGDLSVVRARELDAAADVLGVSVVHHLGFADSGLGPVPLAGGFATVELDRAADRLAQVLVDEGVTDLLCDPLGGVYSHPDHHQANAVAMAAAGRVGLRSVHGVTVDREHLHFVETHLVVDAHRALADTAPGAGPLFGAATVEIDHELRIPPDLLERKRAAMAAHASQMPSHSAVMGLDDDAFASVYGTEWFLTVSGESISRLLR